LELELVKRKEEREVESRLVARTRKGEATERKVGQAGFWFRETSGKKRLTDTVL